MNAGMRVANVISFSCTSLRLDLYSFSSFGELLHLFVGQFLSFGLVLEFLDLLALVDDGLDDVVAQRTPAFYPFYSGHCLRVIKDSAQRIVVHVHQECALPLAGQQSS
jgi:hypothetical protein